MRSQFGETSEALFLTQGFVYDTAEQCEARFKGEEPGFLYSRFSNPTVAMFERRMAVFEGAEVGTGDRDRHGRGDDGAGRTAQGRRSCGGGEGPIRLVPLGGRRFSAALRRSLDPG